MMTINLEKKLMKENKKLATPSELLLINEYDRHYGLVDSDALKRMGLMQSINAGSNVKNSKAKNRLESQRFNQSRVLHISQIESICKKYYLRFLPSRLYKGTLDNKLPEKITTFEVAYGVKCDTDNSYIMAPLRSFNLEDKPKDPLLFYKINNEYYYLIHKWGNDLNVFRRLLPLLSNTIFSFLAPPVVLPLPFLLIHNEGRVLYIAGFAVIFLSTLITNLVSSSMGDGWARLLRVNQWQNQYKDSRF